MSNYGFVYLLSNDVMPLVYKIGYTERSPHKRAEELSAAFGVPVPFEVVCYIETPNFQAVEAKFHQWLAKFRLNPSHEFFKGVSPDYLIGIFCHYPERVAYTAVHPWNVRPLEFELPPNPYVETSTPPIADGQSQKNFETFLADADRETAPRHAEVEENV